MKNKIRLKDLSILITKGTTPTSLGGKFTEEGINFVKSESVGEYKTLDSSAFQFIDEKTNEKLKRSKLAEDDLLVSIAGAYLGKLSIVSQKDLPANTNQAVGIVRLDKKKVNVDYVYYYFSQSSVNTYINNLSSQSSQPNLNLTLLGNLTIDYKTIGEQDNIAKVLNDLDQKIELNNQINQELEGLAKLVYDYWFVQFDFPMSKSYAAKVGKPELEGKPYKSSGGEMVFNEVLKREIPLGWDDCSFEDVAKVIGGSTPSKADASNFTEGNGMPWITPRDLSNNKGKKYITRGEFDVTEKGIKKGSLKLMPAGTVLLSSRAPIGYLAIARETVTTNQGFKSFVPKDYFTSEFLYYQIKNKIPLIEARSGGSTFKEVSASTLKKIKIVKPPEEILSEYQKIIKPLFQKQDLVEKENQELSSLRNWLLPMLMNGQVSVGDLKTNTKLKSKFNVGDNAVFGGKDSELGMVAEPELPYDGEQNLEDIFPTLSYDYELAVVVLLTEQRFNLNYGKKYFHKMFSNMQFLATLPKVKELQFEEMGWGMFSKGLAKSIDAAVYINKSKLDNGKTVYKVKSNSYKEVTTWINDTQNKLFVDEVNTLLSIYEKPLIDKSMDRIELLNTVLECIKVLDTYEFPKIYGKMKTWPMEEPGFDFKADKFSDVQVMHMVGLVKETKINKTL